MGGLFFGGGGPFFCLWSLGFFSPFFFWGGGVFFVVVSWVPSFGWGGGVVVLPGWLHLHFRVTTR